MSLGLVGCGETVDDRPFTLEYLTPVVLAPQCANAQCHSTFRREEDYAFDTVEEARDTIVTYGLVTPGDPDRSILYQVLISPLGGAPPRMPYDRPMPDHDVALIRRWIEEGAPGAACDPARDENVCFGDELRACGDDYSLGTLVENCASRPAGAGMRWTCLVDECVEVDQ